MSLIDEIESFLDKRNLQGKKAGIKFTKYLDELDLSKTEFSESTGYSRTQITNISKGRGPRKARRTSIEKMGQVFRDRCKDNDIHKHKLPRPHISQMRSLGSRLYNKTDKKSSSKTWWFYNVSKGKNGETQPIRSELTIYPSGECIFKGIRIIKEGETVSLEGRDLQFRGTLFFMEESKSIHFTFDLAHSTTRWDERFAISLDYPDTNTDEFEGLWLGIESQKRTPCTSVCLLSTKNTTMNQRYARGSN